MHCNPDLAVLEINFIRQEFIIAAGVNFTVYVQLRTTLLKLVVNAFKYTGFCLKSNIFVSGVFF